MLVRNITVLMMCALLFACGAKNDGAPGGAANVGPNGEPVKEMALNSGIMTFTGDFKKTVKLDASKKDEIFCGLTADKTRMSLSARRRVSEKFWPEGFSVVIPAKTDLNSTLTYTATEKTDITVYIGVYPETGIWFARSCSISLSRVKKVLNAVIDCPQVNDLSQPASKPRTSRLIAQISCSTKNID
ncbi:MAG: hypothetical protein V4736_05010 [Bdellovibrionota bacterium]